MRAVAEIPSRPSRRELIFGLVSPLGTKHEIIEGALRSALRDAGYKLVPKVKISKWLEADSRRPWLLPETPPAAADRSALARKKELMDAGDALRSSWDQFNHNLGRGDAGAFVALTEIIGWRTQVNTGKDDERPGFLALENHAFLIDSLKHPDELDRLRNTYGPAFISIGVYSPRENRRDVLEAELHPNEDVALVDELMTRDENDVDLGQHVADAFYSTDFIVDATRDSKEIKAALRRLIELILGNAYITPEPEEYGMFLARAAQVRSSSLARQIGASVLRNDGTVISLGTNEVPKPIIGGQYWPSDDSNAGRDKDYKLPGQTDVIDTSDWWRDKMLSDVLDRLNESKYFGDKFDGKTSTERLRVLAQEAGAPLRKALIKQDIDYVRAVHAEAASIIDAGRHNTSLLGATMYTTTFPCHECARHIVAAGVSEVVYLEPYPKSGVRILYTDSISVDPVERERTQNPKDRKRVVFRSFVGVSPTRYLEFFSLGKRPRKINGKPISFNIREASPVLPYYTPSPSAIASVELTQTDRFLSFVHDQENNNDGPSPKSKRTAGPDQGSSSKRTRLDVRRRKKA